MALHRHEEGERGDGDQHAGRHDEPPVHDDGGGEEVLDADGQRVFSSSETIRIRVKM